LLASAPDAHTQAYDQLCRDYADPRATPGTAVEGPGYVFLPAGASSPWRNFFAGGQPPRASTLPTLICLRSPAARTVRDSCWRGAIQQSLFERCCQKTDIDRAFAGFWIGASIA
jgi:hypothetical protein